MPNEAPRNAEFEKKMPLVRKFTANSDSQRQICLADVRFSAGTGPGRYNLPAGTETGRYIVFSHIPP